MLTNEFIRVISFFAGCDMHCRMSRSQAYRAYVKLGLTRRKYEVYRDTSISYVPTYRQMLKERNGAVPFGKSIVYE